MVKLHDERESRQATLFLLHTLTIRKPHIMPKSNLYTVEYAIDPKRLKLQDLRLTFHIITIM